MLFPVQSLIPHPVNEELYNLSDIDDLVRSIREVGLLEPLVINIRNQVISGHRRLEVIKELGWDEVEVIKSDLSPDDEPLYIISYNKQRIKTAKEQLAEIKLLYKLYGNHQGQRSDLTSVRIGRSDTRTRVSQEVGVSYWEYLKTPLYRL